VRVVGLAAAGTPNPGDLAEFLRVLVALRACGHSVALLEAGAGARTLGPDAALPTDAERYLDALAEDGVEPSHGVDVAAALAEADALVLLPDSRRVGEPPLLRLRRGVRPGTDALAALTRAGQVILE
jgi:hypothetical protein